MTAESQPLASTERAIPSTLPVLPLPGLVAFPLVVFPLAIAKASSIRLIDDAMRDSRLVLLVAQRTETEDQIHPQEDLYKVGTIAVVDRLRRGSDKTLQLAVQGIERARVVDFVSEEPYLIARIERFPEVILPGVELEGLRRAVLNLLRRLIGLVEDLSEELINSIESLKDIRQLIYLVALTIPLETNVRQELLELDPIDKKLQRLINLLQHEVTIRELGRKIVTDTQERISKTQRDYFLREQVRSIQKELGEGSDQADTTDLRERIDKAGLPPEAKKEAQRELDRLASIPPSSPEQGIIRTYLEWMADLPWNKLSGVAIDVSYARQVLDQDHYDLDKVKDRILEYLAVKQLRQNRQSALQQTVSQQNEAPDQSPQQQQKLKELAIREPILCFVGPPGVGKTSLGQSIARALGRQFIRISLGGIHDEAEIRGHRRTYIGAMPGRIIQGIKRAGMRDAVFMLDEIDKVGADWRGDPSSALLEVLDPAQNYSFMDNYLGVPFDLSQVLFIATANTLDTIPGPLLDRMEVLRLSGYIDEEKVHIAERYLVPKQLEAHGLRPEELSFESAAIRRIARSYTREAGVRNLDREIATICRKVARKIAEGLQEPVHITPELVGSYLGRPRFFDEVAERTERPGVATGLAWTPIGGEVLFVEATMMPSREERLILTGMLGDVMRESAQAALSYVKSNMQLLNTDPSQLEGKTIHLHVPAGAIPKDGPSAGVTMATALASLVSKRHVRGDVAMTGEITLRGKVLPVGGIKEKVLGAHRAKIKTVILPRHNERDLEDVPSELRRDMEYRFADTMEEVLRYALEPSPDSQQASIGQNRQPQWAETKRDEQ